MNGFDFSSVFCFIYLVIFDRKYVHYSISIDSNFTKIDQCFKVQSIWTTFVILLNFFVIFILKIVFIDLKNHSITLCQKSLCRKSLTICFIFSKHLQTLGIFLFSVKSFGWNKSSLAIPNPWMMSKKILTRNSSGTYSKCKSIYYGIYNFNKMVFFTSTSLLVTLTISVGTALNIKLLMTLQRILPSLIQSSKSSFSGVSCKRLAIQLAVLCSKCTSRWMKWMEKHLERFRRFKKCHRKVSKFWT